jgi:hypothetical protein
MNSLITNGTELAAFAEPTKEMTNNSKSNGIVLHLGIFCSLPHQWLGLLTVA